MSSDEKALRAALRRIIKICRDSRQLHGGDPKLFRAWRIQVEEAATDALGEKGPRHLHPKPPRGR